jgi:spermidine/putrescine-binding protein
MNNRFRRARRLLPLAVLPMITLAACGGDSGDSGSADDCETGQVDGDLYLYNWSEYIDPELKDAFAAEYGVEVIEDNYDSNEATPATT